METFVCHKRKIRSKLPKFSIVSIMCGFGRRSSLRNTDLATIQGSAFRTILGLPFFANEPQIFSKGVIAGKVYLRFGRTAHK